MPSKALVCGATKTEADACRQGIRQAGLEERFEILHIGIGPAEAAESLKARLSEDPKPSLVISSGFAGSWSPELDVGCWITAASVSNELKNSISGLQPIPGATSVHLVSVPEIFETPPRALIEGLSQLPIGVDMESFSLAQVCRSAGVEFRALRYVTDSPKHPLPAFVRHFTDVAVRKDFSGRMGSLLQGSRALITEASQIAGFMKHGVRWRSELISGWARFAHSIH